MLLFQLKTYCFSLQFTFSTEVLKCIILFFLSVVFQLENEVSVGGETAFNQKTKLCLISFLADDGLFIKKCNARFDS